MKHKSAIAQMYFRERGTCEDVPTSKEYFRLIDIANKIQEDFLEKLNGDEELIKLYNKNIDALMEAQCEDSDNHFFEGFRFGVLMGLDIANENPSSEN